MDLIEKLADNMLAARYEKLPDDTISDTKQRILDTLGVMAAGAAECSREAGLMKDWGGREESTVMVHGGKVPAANAAWVNSIMSGALDYDDAMVGALHISATTVPTALAISEMGKVSGKEFITAVAAGADLAARIHLASSVRFQATGNIMVFGSAAIAARLQGMDRAGLLDSLGIAFTRAAGTNQVATDKVLALRLIQGFASRSGVEAAMMAQRGLTGVKNILQGEYGLFSLYSRGEPDTEAITDLLGSRYEGQRAFIKKYPSCGTTHSATAATLKLVSESDIEADQVKSVAVHVSPYVCTITGQPFKIVCNPRVEAQFSLPYTVANAVLRKSSRLEHFNVESVSEKSVMELANRVKAIPDPEIDGISAMVEIEMKDGMKYATHIDHTREFLEKPLTREELLSKFDNCMAYAANTAPARHAAEIVAAVDRLEQLDDVRELVNLMVE